MEQAEAKKNVINIFNFYTKYIIQLSEASDAKLKPA